MEKSNTKGEARREHKNTNRGKGGEKERNEEAGIKEMPGELNVRGRGEGEEKRRIWTRDKIIRKIKRRNIM